ncbi:MAG: hypothetical protein Q4E10_03905 [Porphyromonas sp.]|nr:hypothetical protein [Porphyromonas sp.]
MKIFKTISMVLATMLMAVAIVSCEDDKEQPTPDNGGDTYEGTDLKGAIEGAVKLEATTYTLSGALEIKKGGSLTIPAGTIIKAKQGFSNYIIVEQGGKIFINGTAQAPVKMIPDKENAGSGYWGGLILCGYAPITNGGTNKVEIDPGKVYGGDNPDDNSGVITYLTLDGTGARNNADVEHNGLTLNGVGRGTKIENIYIVNGADDAIEFFGGTVNVTNLLAVDSEDDMFDFTEGYSGTLKNAYGVWTDDFVTDEGDPRGVEADGNHDGKAPEGTPQSNFNIDGITIDLRTQPSTADGHYMHDAFKIRRGATATITNALIKGKGQLKNIVNMDDKKGVGNAASAISYTSRLSTAITGDALKGEANVKVEDNLKGADVATFDWTNFFDNNAEEEVPTTPELKGAIVDETVLEAKTYTLSGVLEIKKGGSLTIPAGTTIKATEGFNSYIIVEQGGKIFVNGTAEQPVRMIPDNENAGSGYWGGLILCGYAPITNGGTNKVEIDPEKVYGGDDPADNSGVITYLTLDGTGARNSADVEHNGLTLNGVGNGTKIENIYIINGADDAVEFFGGTVNVTNLLAVDSEDDMFDFTEGYSGTLKNAYGVWTDDFVTDEGDPRGVEADGNHDGKAPEGTPQSNFNIDGITIDLRTQPSTADGHYMHDAFKIRRGATATITNALVKGKGQLKNIVNMEDKKGAGNAASTISYSTRLSTAISGDALKGEANVNVEEGLKGADTATFAWTNFFDGDSDDDSDSDENIYPSSDLKGEITEETFLESKTYTLSAPLEIKKGGSLIIPAGTTIKAKEGFYSYIIVEQGGKIFVNGTEDKPVRMIPDKENVGSGYWGGLILCGYAPITNGGTNKVEIDPEKVYGGDDPADNSGVITYLTLDGTGARNSADVEHNGLTLHGVGSGTKIENIYIVNGADDAIEFFGGTVDVTNLLAVDSEDDMFDFTEGYSGTLTNAYGVWSKDFVTDEDDPRGVEADGNHDGKAPNGKPQSDFKIDGITIELLMEPSTDKGHFMNEAFKIRRGAKATITNALLKGQGQLRTIIDMTDKKGNGVKESAISYTSKLTTEISGEELKGEANVTITDDLTGADTSKLIWTGYKFN